MTIRAELWDVAVDQHGYFTLADARALGFDEVAVRMMAARNRLEHPARGVFRFGQMPASEQDPYQLAVLWAATPEAALSHETALAIRGYGDINPDRIHLTVAAHRRIRRTPAGPYQVHYQDLDADELGWWSGVRAVTPATAVRQCLATGTPAYLLRQAIDEARRDGGLTPAEADALTPLLTAGLVDA